MTILKPHPSKTARLPSRLASPFTSKNALRGLWAGLAGLALTSPVLSAAAATRPSSSDAQSAGDPPTVQRALPNTPAEFQVNTYTTSYQYDPAVAMDADGDFVVVWESVGSSGTDSDSYSIQAQRYNSSGVAQGGQFQVNTYTTSQQVDATVAMDADGDFVVAWRSDGSSGTDTDSLSIQAQRYDSFGAALGSQFQVNTITSSYQTDPMIAMDADGDFVVAWRSEGSSGTDTDSRSIQAQRYNSSGLAQSGQFQVNTYTTGSQHGPAIAMDADGDFVVAWWSDGSSGTDTDGTSIQAQRYNSSGVPQSGEFQVNSYTTNSQAFPAIAMDLDGGFVVAWRSDGSSGADTDSLSIQAQRYNSSGIPQSGQFQVNTYTTGRQSQVAVAMDANGDFVVAWQSKGSSGSDIDDDSVQARRYLADGTATGLQFQVNTYTTGSQALPALTMDADGDLVMAWHSEGSSGTDTDTFSIQARRYPKNRVYLPIVVR